MEIAIVCEMKQFNGPEDQMVINNLCHFELFLNAT